jgi:sec-independent protein translocase protein TatA
MGREYLSPGDPESFTLPDLGTLFADIDTDKNLTEAERIDRKDAIIAVLVLVLFGAKKLPTFARSLGKSMGEFKKAREEFEHELTKASDEVERPTIPQTAEKRQPVASSQDI